MINIDDFVREKLGGQPEKADPAAWLKMKALLDKEMPERAVPFYFRLGKPMAFLGAALLLSILCVGGYELTKGIRAKNNASEFTVNTKISTSSSSSSSNKSSASALEPKDQPIDAQAANTSHSDDKETLTDNSNSAQSGIELKPRNTTGHSAHLNKAVASAASSSKPADNIAIKNNGTVSNEGAVNTAGTVKKEAATASAISKTSVKTKLNSATSVKTSGTSTSATSDKNLPKEETIAINNNSVVNNSKTLASNSPDEGGSLEKTGNKSKLSAGGKTGTKKSNNNNSEEMNSSAQQWAAGKGTTAKSSLLQNATAKDSLPFTSIVQKETVSKSFPRTATTLVDTQSVGKIALQDNSVPASVAQNEEKPAQTAQKKGAENKSKKDNEFAAANKDNSSKAKDSSAASSNNSQASKSKKAKNKSLWDNLNLPEVASDAKRDLGNAKFYAGFSGGFNYSLSNTNNFQGVQFGPTGELVFNKHWSLFGAIRYFNRSGGTKTVNDNYTKENAANTPDSTYGANWYFKVHTDSTNRYFNFSTLHSFEMPITLRYALNKFYLLTGLNLAYYLSVNVEEVQKTYSLNSHMVQTNSAKPILNETKPLLNTNDFGSKFGLGFVLGAGYQIAPAWQADLRLVNTFWDNSKGDGANKLSKDFYKLPSVQISVGYQFNRGRVKPTFGPTNTQ